MKLQIACAENNTACGQHRAAFTARALNSTQQHFSLNMLMLSRDVVTCYVNVRRSRLGQL